MNSVLSRLVEAEKLRLNIEPESISEIIYKWNLRDFLDYANSSCNADICFGVSDLVYCSQKLLYKRKYPELVIGDNIYASWASYGRLIHAGLQQLLKKYGFDTEEIVEKIINVQKMKVLIHGRIDAVGFWKGNLTIVEIKSSRSDLDLPKEPHILQLRTYMNLAEAERGILIYVTSDRVTEYSFNEPLSDNDLKKLVEEALNKDNHPRYSWECSYCPFNILCPYKQNNYRGSRR